MSHVRRRGADPAPGRRASAGAPAVARASGAIEHVVPVFGLLGAQLGHVVATTEQAALSFLTEVQAVDAAAGDVAVEAGRLADLTAEQATELAEIATISRSSGEVIEQLVAFVVRRDQAVIDLVAEVRGLSDHLGIIQKISRATTTLALNAKIEASRAGEHGAGFQVVADEVRELSRQSDTAARDIGQKIEQLARRLAEAMADHADGGPPNRPGDDTEEVLTDRLGAVAQQQRALVERLDTFTGRVDGAARQLVVNSGTVHALTTSMMGELQFQDVTRQVIENVVGALDQLGPQLTAVADVLAGRGDVEGIADLEAAMDRIRDGYVMHRQRVTHAQVTGSAVQADAAPAIELF